MLRWQKKMKGKYQIIIETLEKHIEFVVSRKITILTGFSGVGKTMTVNTVLEEMPKITVNRFVNKYTEDSLNVNVVVATLDDYKTTMSSKN